MSSSGASATRDRRSVLAAILALVASLLLSFAMWWTNDAPQAPREIVFFALGGLPLAVTALLYLAGAIAETLAAGVFIGVGLPYLPLLTKLPEWEYLAEPHVWIALSAMALCFIAGALALAAGRVSGRSERAG